MALRAWDDLSGDFGLAAPFRSPDQLIHDESSWADLSGRWASFTNHSSVFGHAGLRLPSLLKNTSPFALRAPNGYDGGAGGQATPPPPTGGPLATGPGDNIGDNMSSTTTIAIGGTINSSINTGGDLDYIRVTLTAGQTYVFSMEGISLVDPLLDLRDSSGTLVATDDDGGIGRDAFLMYHAETSGDYWIVAQGWSVLSGTYSLTVNAIDTGNSSPTTFPDNGKRPFSWDEAGVQINRDGAGWTDAFGTPPSQVITYAFRASEPFTMPEGTGEFSRFSAAQIAAAEHALAAWAAVANVTFVRVSDAATPGYSDSATILFGNYATGAAGAAAFAYLPINANRSVSSLEGDVWVNNSLSYNANPVLGDYGYQVLLHEIGHALGLTHPGEYNAGEGEGPIEYPTHAEYFNDSRVFTVMSYFGSVFVGGNLGLFASLPQLHDIAAIQRLYGANFATRTGDTIYGYNSNTGLPEYTLELTNEAAVFAVWDGGGLDTLDFSGYTTANTIDLRAEAFSSVGGYTYNVSIARGVVIENAIGGSGADTIIGNAANNTLNGGAGADNLNGAEGDDTLIGGNGNDTLIGGLGFDTIQGGAGNDTITYAIGDGGGVIDGGADTDTLNITDGASASNLTASWNGSALTNVAGNSLANVENINVNMGGGVDWLIYSATAAVSVNLATGAASGFASIAGIESVAGGSGDDTIVGDALANQLAGGAGNDALDGGGGDDRLIGGAGADTLNGGDGVDTADYSSSTGRVVVRLSTGLGQEGDAQGDTLSGIENLVGGSGNDALIGSTSSNVLTGGSGNDYLDGLAGDDTLNGGDGDDRLVGGAGADILNGGAGTDLADYSQATGRIVVRLWSGLGEEGVAQGDVLTSIENLTGGSGNDALIGSGAANVLRGGAGNDRLDGMAGDDIINGGAGADTMLGGDGIDTLSYEDATSRVVVRLSNQTASEGEAQGDVISGFENLIGGAGNDALIGSDAVGNVIKGGGGSDYIDGLSGDDFLFGGDGNDRLVGGAGADVLDGGAGIDLADYSATSGRVVVRLSNGTGQEGVAQGDTLISIENVTGGSGNDALIGSGSANVLIGGAGDDYLDGQAGNDTLNGGLGADRLLGGANADTFVFDSALGQSNIDQILDFSSGEDTIQLNHNVFSALAIGVLDAEAFVVGAAAADADDRIIYDAATGALYYDPDGDGAAAAIQFAVLVGAPALTHQDFIVGG